VTNLRKRSVLLAGHATSIALEPEFWAVLEARARAGQTSLAGLMSAIDRGRGARPLASACRLAALAFAQAGSEPGAGTHQPDGDHEAEDQQGAQHGP
jgi:predicted DNA-binding ribbon-helix-helix protein